MATAAIIRAATFSSTPIWISLHHSDALKLTNNLHAIKRDEATISCENKERVKERQLIKQVRITVRLRSLAHLLARYLAHNDS